MDRKDSSIQVTQSQLIEALREAFEHGSTSDETDDDCLTIKEIQNIFEKKGVEISRGRIRLTLEKLIKNGTVEPTKGRKRL